MPYLPLPNFNHDSGPRRIQSGPDHEGYVVLYSGVESTGANEGIVVAGSPLSGTAALGAWDYDSNWRYVPSTLSSQSGTLDPTPYNSDVVLDTYDAARIYTRNTVAGAQAASAIGPETGKVNPRGGQPERYMYFGGAAPDNQDYSPYNTPDANSAAEGKTGGGVTHRAYESSLLTNVLGSQGTSDRSQWRYHQPVYCKTYTETRRSETPGLMSTPLRYVYRGAASSWGSASSLGPVGSYNYNYGSELLANRGGFELLPYESPDPTQLGPMGNIPAFPGDTLTAPAALCNGAVITRTIGNIGDEQNAISEIVTNFTIPLNPPAELGATWSNKYIVFSCTCPTGEKQVADTLTTTSGTWEQTEGRVINVNPSGVTVFVDWSYSYVHTINECANGALVIRTTGSGSGVTAMSNVLNFTINRYGGGQDIKPCGAASRNVSTIPTLFQYTQVSGNIVSNRQTGSAATGGGFVSQIGVMTSVQTTTFRVGSNQILPPFIIQ